MVEKIKMKVSTDLNCRNLSEYDVHSQQMKKYITKLRNTLLNI